MIDAVLINGVSGIGLIDTGSNGLFKLAPAAVAKFGLEENLAQSTATDSAAFLGVSQNRTGVVDKIAIGPFVQDNPALVFFGSGMGRDDVPWDLNIGNGFLEDFIMSINYPDRQLILKESPMHNINQDSAQRPVQ